MANVYYSAPFNLAAIDASTPLGTLTLTHAGESDIVINLNTLTTDDYNGDDSQWFWHIGEPGDFVVIGNPSGVVQYPHIALLSLGVVLQDALNAAAIVASWPTSDFVVSWEDSVYPHYVITYGSAFTVAFSTEAGQALFGGNAGPLGPGATSASDDQQVFGGAQFVTSVAAGPTLLLGVRRISVSEELDGADVEPRGVATAVVSDSGRGYGNHRSVSYFHRDWVQKHCTEELIYGPHQVFTTGFDFSPWPFIDLIQYCRSSLPFYVAFGEFGNEHDYEVFVLREESNFIRPRRATVGNNVQWHQEFRARVVGYFTDDPP